MHAPPWALAQHSRQAWQAGLSLPNGGSAWDSAARWTPQTGLGCTALGDPIRHSAWHSAELQRVTVCSVTKRSKLHAALWCTLMHAALWCTLMHTALWCTLMHAGLRGEDRAVVAPLMNQHRDQPTTQAEDNRKKQCGASDAKSNHDTPTLKRLLPYKAKPSMTTKRSDRTTGIFSHATGHQGPGHQLFAITHHHTGTRRRTLTPVYVYTRQV